MLDNISPLSFSRNYFLKFKNSKIQDYRRALKEYGSPYRSGYPRYKNDEKIARYLNDLIGNFDEGLEDVAIPELFSSPKQLIAAWKGLYEFIKKNQELIDKTGSSLMEKKERSEVFAAIVEIHNEIKGCLEFILDIQEVQSFGLPVKTNAVNRSTSEENESFQIAIITALHDTEFVAFQQLLPTFIAINSDDCTQYLSGTVGGRKVIIATDDKMGMAAATALTIKVLVKFKPLYVIMGGIAAGVKSEERNFGDVLIARWTFNYESGKYQYKQKSKQTVFEPNPEQIELEGIFTSIINQLKNDHSSHEAVYSNFTATSDKKKPLKAFNVHFGPIASGSAVLADDKKVEEIRTHNRKLIGIDMETFGVYYGCKSMESFHKAKAISIKSISDFADKRKTDGYREYAAYTSASFIIKLIEKLPGN